MTHPLDNGPDLEGVLKATKFLAKANDAVRRYVDEALKGYPSTWAYCHSASITLTGHGRVWRDARGHRVHKRINCQYGDWQRLDELIAEAKAHYDSKRSGGK